MIRFCLGRIVASIPVVIVVAACTFLIFQALPGGAAEAILGEGATPEAVAQLNHQLGLDRPIVERFFSWLGSAVRGDFGNSITSGQSVSSAIASHLEVSVFLVLYSLLIGIVIGVPLGVLAGSRPQKWWSQVLMGGAALGISLPRFFVGVLLVMLFAVRLGWLPATGYVPISDGVWQSLESLILPCLALGMSQAAHLARVTRASMVQVIELDYIRYARSKGFVESRVIWRHAVPNALTATIMTVALSLGSLISGALVIEVVFALPGLGTLMFQSVQNRDIPVLQGVIFLIAVSYILATLLADIIHGLIDPRVRKNR